MDAVECSSYFMHDYGEMLSEFKAVINHESHKNLHPWASR